MIENKVNKVNKVKELIQKKQFEDEQNLYDDILYTINEYQGKISLVACLGILDLIKDEMKLQAKME